MNHDDDDGHHDHDGREGHDDNDEEDDHDNDCPSRSPRWNSLYHDCYDDHDT